MLALSLTMTVSGCGTLNKWYGFTIEAPPLTEEEREECPDVDVAEDARIAVADTRFALAECRKLKQDVVDKYEAVRAALGKN